MKRKVLFTTDSDKFYGVILERLLRNEAALESLGEQIALIRAQIDGSSLQEIREGIIQSRDQAYDRLAASLIAHLTDRQHRNPLESLGER